MKAAPSTHPGDAIAKKLTRLAFWMMVSRLIGNDAFLTKAHAVLASRCGGDIAALVGLGVPQDNIFAIDEDEEALVRCSKRWPKVHYGLGDVFDRLKQLLSGGSREQRARLASAYLDFCGVIDRKMLIGIDQLVGRLEPGTIIGVNVHRGHEKDPYVQERFADERRAEDARREAIVREMKEEGHSEEGDVLPDCARAYLIQNHVFENAARRQHKGLSVEGVTNYRSSRPGVRGADMCMMTFRVVERSRSESLAAFVLRTRLAWGKAIDEDIRNIDEMKLGILDLRMQDYRGYSFSQMRELVARQMKAYASYGLLTHDVFNMTPDEFDEEIAWLEDRAASLEACEASPLAPSGTES